MFRPFGDCDTWIQTQGPTAAAFAKIPIPLIPLISVADQIRILTDPHQVGKPSPDQHYSETPDPHQSVKSDPLQSDADLQVQRCL
jgi:hypothetical protein